MVNAYYLLPKAWQVLSKISFNENVRATHGVPSERNSHPHRSDPTAEFTVVHNGIITNYKELRTVLEKFGHVFESDTDTEAVAKLAKFVYDNQKKASGNITFTGLVKAVCKELVKSN
jgi:glucosamine--fructose-6-phosphate aminotransferase (isomerizing)